MWARINNGAVAEITDIDPAGRFHPSIQWKPTGSDTEVGDLFDDGQYSKPEGPSIDDLTAAKLAEINSASERVLADLRHQYPQFEIDTWRDQETEARAWVEDNSVPTPTLDGIAEGRGMSVADLVPRVIINADTYRPKVTAVIGKRQRLEDDLNAAKAAGDREAIAAVAW